MSLKSKLFLFCSSLTIPLLVGVLAWREGYKTAKSEYRPVSIKSVRTYQRMSDNIPRIAVNFQTERNTIYRLEIPENEVKLLRKELNH